MRSKPGEARGHYNTRPKPTPDLTKEVIKKIRSCEQFTLAESKYFKKFRPDYWTELMKIY